MKLEKIVIVDVLNVMVSQNNLICSSTHIKHICFVSSMVFLSHAVDDVILRP